MTLQPTRVGRTIRSRRFAIPFALLVLAAVWVGIASSGSSYQPLPTGLPDAGPVVFWALPLVTGLWLAVSMAATGLLLYASFLDPTAGKTYLSTVGRQACLRVGWFAAASSLLAIVAAVLTVSEALGVRLDQALSVEVLRTYAWDIATTRMLLLSGIAALALAIGCVLTVRLTTVTLWLALGLASVALPATAGHAAGLGNHSIAISSSIVHVVAAATWIGGLLALALAARSQGSLVIAGQRFSRIAATCLALMAVSGLLSAYTRVDSAAQLVTTGYGRIILVKAGLLIGLAILGYSIRVKVLRTLDGGRRLRSFLRLASIELVIMAFAVGLGVALASSPPPRTGVPLNSAAEELLGFEFPPAPSAWRLLTGWNFDALFFALAVGGAVLYVIGVVRLRRRGDYWPVGRTLSWLAGLAVLLWSTNAGIAAYAQVSVGLHMVQHMMLSMIAPIPLVLGAPITLALRAIKPSPTQGRGPRELLLIALHSPVARFYTNPAVILAIYSVGLYGLYFTGVFGSLMSSHIGHMLMTAHFLISGALLAWVAIGIDPQPRPLPHWGRLLLVFATIVIHAFFAIALMMTASAIGQPWYSIVRPPWIDDLAADSALGGQIAWGMGEIPTLLLVMVVAVQWYRSDRRVSKRRDRQVERTGDTELAAYNAYLAKLAARDAEYAAKERKR